MMNESYSQNLEKKGLVAMVNNGDGTNGSGFFITLSSGAHLDHSAVVVGEVVEGLEGLCELSLAGNKEGKVMEEIRVVDT